MFRDYGSFSAFSILILLEHPVKSMTIMIEKKTTKNKQNKNNKLLTA